MAHPDRYLPDDPAVLRREYVGRVRRRVADMPLGAFPVSLLKHLCGLMTETDDMCAGHAEAIERHLDATDAGKDEAVGDG